MKFIKNVKNNNGKFAEVPYVFLCKDEQADYLKICLILWGCVPVDVEWAMQTNRYKNMKEKNNIMS